MRRAVQLLAVLTLLLLLVLPVALLGTSTGAGWVLQYAETRLPLDVKGVQGSLWRGLELARLRYSNDGLRVELRQLELSLRWRCALESTICIRKLVAAEVAVELPAAAGDNRAGMPDRLPLSLLPRMELGAVAVRALSLRRGESTERFERIELAGRLGPKRVELQRFSVAHSLGRATATGVLRRSGDWTLDAGVQLDDSVTVAPGIVLPRAWTSTIAGDLRSLAGTVESRSPPALQLEFELELPRGTVPLGFTGTVTGLAGLLPQLADLPWLQLSGPLRVMASAADSQRRLDIEQALTGYAPQPLPLSLSFLAQGDEWLLDSARLGDSGAPLLRARGELGTLSQLAPRLQVALQDFTPPAAADLPLTSISGTASLGFNSADPGGSWFLQSPRITARERANHWNLAADLRADSAALFPIGTVTGQRNELPFDYTRAAGGRTAAELELPDGLQLGDYALSAVSARLRPGDPLVIAIESGGDIDGGLELELRQSSTGADLALQPFALTALGEAVVSERAITGRWNRDGNTITLDSFCLGWKRNRGCSDGAEFGESGSLQLAVTIDEALSGALANKPYALQARGDGQLELVWTAAGLERAALDLAFESLSLDPFVGGGTRPPIAWEQASTALAWTPAAQALALELESARLGTVSLSLREQDSGLEGQMAIAALDMDAFNDLMPEWAIDGGRLDSQLRVEGSRAAPLLFGNLSINNLRAELPGMESPLTDATLALTARGSRVDIRGDAQLGGGPLTLEGVCCDDRELRAQLTGFWNQVVLPVGLDARVSPELDIRLDPESLSLGGLITVHSGVLKHSGAVSGGVALSDDVVRIDLPPKPQQRFALTARLRTLIEPGFSLRSKELLATLAGDLRLDLAPEQPPAMFGNLQVLGGELRAYGQALRLTEGVVGFVGDPLNPELDLSAEREIRAENLRVGFRVRGSLEEPTLELFSDPQRSERDTLSYLLRGRGPDVGASVDSTAMALSLGASAINQTGLLGSLNAIPGLSGVKLGAEGSDEDMAATISGYVGERLYLSYGLGVYEPVNALTARLYLRSRLWLEVVSRLESSLDLYYRFDRN